MPTVSWRSFARAAPERDYLALLTYLPLHSAWRIPRLILETRRIISQLRESPGLVGYSLRAQPMAKRFWTLSVWEDEASLQGFVHARPHTRTMTVLAPHMGSTRFLRWTIKGAQVPPSWDDAVSRLSAG